MMKKRGTNVAASVRQRLMNLRQTMRENYNAILAQYVVERLSEDALAQAMSATFCRRQTELPSELPVGLSDEFGGDAAVQRRWQDFLRRLETDDAPESFVDVIAQVRERVWPIMERARCYRPS